MSQSVFRSNQPEVMEVWNTWTANQQKFSAFLDEIEAEFGRKAYYTRSGASGNIVVGFAPKDEGDRENAEDEGLRFDRTYKFLVPKKGVHAGKRLAKRFQENSLPAPEWPGMPRNAVTGDAKGLHWHAPGAEVHNNTVYLMWGCKDTEVGEVDLTLWERVSLGEWFTLKGE